LKLLLDTSFLIALKRGRKEALKILEERKEIASDVGVSRLSQYELLVGASYIWRRYGDLREREWVEEALRWLSIYEIDEEVIRSAAEIKAQSVINGENIPDLDLLIALSGKRNTELLTFDEDQIKASKYLEKMGVKVLEPKH